MRSSRTLGVLYIFLFLLSGSAHAAAEGCSTSVNIGLGTGYADTGDSYLATGKPVMQGGATLVCTPAWLDGWKASLDGWVSYELAGGRFGHRDYGDGIEGTATLGKSVSVLGVPFDVEGSAAYWVLPSFSKTRDHMIQVYGEGGLPLALGEMTLEPYVRASGWIGLGALTTSAIARPGLRFDAPLPGGFSLAVDAYHSFFSAREKAAGGSFAVAGYKDASQAAIALSHDFLDSRVNLSLNAQFSTGIRSTVGFTLRYNL
jgi:hypothetical protein